MEETLGKRISARRKGLGLTQDALAEQLGITAQAVSKWENDQSCPDITMLPRLAEIFRCTTDELLGLAPKEKQTADSIPPEETAAEPEPNAPGIRLHTLSSPGAAFGFWLFLTGAVSLLDAVRPSPCELSDIAICCGIFVFGLFSLFRRFSLLRLGCTLAGGVFVVNLLIRPGIADMDWRIPLCAGLALFGLDMLLNTLRGKKRILPARHRMPSCTKNSFVTDAESFSCSTSFGEANRLVTLQRLSGGQAEVNFGELTLDLTGCRQFSETCLLKLDCNFGDMTVLIPRSCRAEINISTVFADCDTRGAPCPETSDRIYVNGDACFGHITIRYI